MRTFAFCAALIAPGLVLGAPAAGALIEEVSPLALSANRLEDLNSLTGGTYPGTNYDEVIHTEGISFAECFLGQSITTNGHFDEVSGAPVGGLQLAAGAQGQNLTVWGNSNQIIAGNGVLGFPNQSSVSEGAFAMLFDEDQGEIGLDLLGLNGGAVTMDFYRRDGSLIDSLTLFTLGDGGRAFRRDGGISDIAGVVITTTDLGGIGFDNFFFSAQTPSPGALALLGLAAVLPRRRRR